MLSVISFNCIRLSTGQHNLQHEAVFLFYLSRMTKSRNAGRIFAAIAMSFSLEPNCIRSQFPRPRKFSPSDTDAAPHLLTVCH